MGLRSEAYSKLISGRGVLGQIETSKTNKKKQKHGSKNYWNIFLVEYGSTILGKIFEIK